MNFILQCGVLFTFLALGELIVWLTGIAVPSSILGMLLLTLSLKLRIVRLRHVDRIADFLTHNLGFFFVPAGVGLIGCLDLIAREWIPIAGAMVVSTAVILTSQATPISSSGSVCEKIIRTKVASWKNKPK